MTDSDGSARAALDRRVSEHADAAIALSEDLRAHPELGYAEHYAAEHAATWLRERGLSPRTGLAGTGLRVDLKGAAPGPTVALVGELDAVHLPSHPDAAADGAAPACGHHASLAAVCCATVAVAELLPSLAGRLTLLLVPAEEMLPPEHLAAARAAGTTVRATGKAELLRLGELDDVDLALMVHTGREGGPRFSVGDTLRGAVAITATFRGQAAHGGASPELGVDAVRAARQALDALDLIDGAAGLGIAAALRQPTAALGSVPAECHLDVLVRADTVDGLRDGVRTVDDALDTGAAAVGAGLERRTELAYAPTRSSAALDDVVAACATEIVGAQDQARGRALGASTDMGDLSLVMPVTHAYSSGVVGHPHSLSYRVVDSERAVVEPARYLARAVVDLLADDAAVARIVLATPPAMARPEYDALRASFDDLRCTEPQDAPATDRGAAR
jgi:amidohydrolase